MSVFALCKALLRAVMASLVFALAAHAGDRGTAPEAEALVKRAVAYIKANGADKAYDEFTNGKSFKDRDLYIVVYNFDGKNLAHGANPKLVGKDLMGLKDPDGKMPLKMYLDLMKEKNSGWTDSYKFLNPTTKKLEPKIMYLERVGDTMVGSGIYKD